MTPLPESGNADWAYDRQFAGASSHDWSEGSIGGYSSLTAALDDLRGRRPHPLALATFFYDPADLDGDSVAQAACDGHRLLRFGGIPVPENTHAHLKVSAGRSWQELLDLGTDVICTDDAAVLQTHLSATGRGSLEP
jgi:hypothetical protein